MNKVPVSGFDLGPTLAWYEQHQDVLHDRVDQRTLAAGYHSDMEYKFTGIGPWWTPDDAERMIALFPVQARGRSNLAEVRQMKPHWFHRDSLPGRPQETDDPGLALSHTAIIPSQVLHPQDSSPLGFSSHVLLHAMPTVKAGVAALVHRQAFVHEVAHSILAPVLYGDAVTLKFSDGVIPDVMEHLANHVPSLVNGKPPISHYAGAYFRADGNLPDESDIPALVLAVNEVMAEAIAAYLLGFAYQPNGNGLDPFAEHSDLRRLVRNFLYAQPVAV